MILAKQELREIEKYINDASFIVATRGVKDPAELKLLSEWITKAQLDTFCLEDQIDMYAIQGIDEYQLYAMKSAIGKLSIKEVTKNIKTHIDNMPIDLQIMAKVSEISHSLRYSHPVLADTMFDNETRMVQGFLASDDDRQVLFIIGGQGSGKTTLMDKVFEDCDVKNKFNLCSRVNVSETRGLVGLLKEVLEGSTVDPDAIDEFEIMKTIHDTFKDKRYLIVLDDVQDTRVLYSLMHVLKDSKGKIICLTRVDDIHEKRKVVRIGKLKDDDALRLFRSAVFPDYTSTDLEGGFRNALISHPSGLLAKELVPMEDMLKNILSKCQGNPWNLRTIGTLLGAYSGENGYDYEKWGKIKERVDGILIGTERVPTIKLEDAKSPGDIRLGFLYCLAFPDSSEIPENAGIPKRKLIRLWMAEGFLQDSLHHIQEQQAEELLDELIKRKLLVVKKRAVDGKVLKYSVNEGIRTLALNMCKYQKFCRFLPDNGGEESPPTSRTDTSPTLSSLNILPWRNRALSTRYRMLAMHGDGGIKEAATALGKDIRLRSLLYFRTGMTARRKLELSFQRRYKLLRTLELQGAHLDRLPSSIGYLVCLRYLGLRGTQLEYLPSSWQRLKNLMCLDIRDTNITRLEDVSAFTEMRHLLLANSFRDKFVHILNGLKFLINLQTLSGAKPGLSPNFEQQLSCLQFLRKLSIKKAPSESSERVCRAIGKMEFLQSLTITCDGEQFGVRSLKIGKNLRKLKLGGDMGALCDSRLSMMQSITYLYLWDSKLQDNPLLRLQGLQHLLLLSLYNAYTGEELGCTNGYHRLKKLSIISMENLKECKFGPGALKNLEELVFAKCGKLKSPPAGLRGIQSLREVHLAQMLPEFYKAMEDIVPRDIIRDVPMDFHEFSRATSEGSQTTAIEPIAPPATTEENEITTDGPMPAPATSEGSPATIARTTVAPPDSEGR
ncbi:disease resistance protein RPM1-like [Phragmites australis]|uniref:disease resistance protein RPM1-like n=1 Tax=Phragmites australis TaxID=29695 RepID=UPI002D79A5D4|nr:disease resistance protein RPM1-like [Phragmites australis]